MYALDVRCLINVSHFQSNIELLLGDLQPAFVSNVEKICISCSLWKDKSLKGHNKNGSVIIKITRLMRVSYASLIQ